MVLQKLQKINFESSTRIFLEEVGEGESLEQSPPEGELFTKNKDRKPKFKFFVYADWYKRWIRGVDRTS